MTTYDSSLGQAPDGTDVGLVKLHNGVLDVDLTNYGARMLSIEAPAGDGTRGPVLLGFDRLDQILKAGSFGAVLGRYANRIADGRFTLDGETYQLSVNDPPNTLHGGKKSFAKCFWTLAERSDTSASWTLESPDGDQGFPGHMSARAIYTLEGSALRRVLEASVDKPCPINLSAHPYFNLAGAEALDCHDHELEIFAGRFLPTDGHQIPTGELAAVAGTLFDFRRPVRIGERVRNPDPQLMVARGYDHCFVIDGEPGSLRRAARVSHAATGRTLEIDTDLPGLQVYTGNSLDGSLIGHGGTSRQTAGLALEAQRFPDAPNQPSFPPAILRPGERFQATILYRFGLI